MINTEEKRLTASPYVAVVELTYTYSYRGCADQRKPLLLAGVSLKTKKLLRAWLTFIFIGLSVGKKIFRGI